MKQDTLNVTIKNWEKYNPRTDVKESSWFRFSHSMIEDDDFFDFTHEEFKAWIYILSQASKKGSGSVRICLTRAKSIARIKRRAMESAIKKLQFCGILENHDTSTYVHDTSTCSTYGRTNERTALSAEQMGIALREWGETLTHFGINKDPKLDELPIARQIQSKGFEQTLHALIGAKFESKTDTFDPGKHLSLRRIFDPKHFEKFQLLGYQARTKAKREVVEVKIPC